MDQYRMLDSNDLTAFLSGFSTFIKKVAVYLFTSVKNNLIVFVATLAVALTASVLYWQHAKPYYEAEMAFNFKELNKKSYGEMLHQLDLLARDHSYDSLAALLKIQVAQAQSIISIEGKNMSGSMLYEDITPNIETAYINVKARNNTIFNVLQPALVNYLNIASPITVNNRQQDSISIYKKIAYLYHDIAILDSIISAYRSRVNANALQTPALGFLDLLDRRNKLEDGTLELERKAREIVISVIPVHGFIPSEHPVQERNKNLKIAIVASFIVALGLSILARVIKDANSYKQTHPVS